MNIINPMDEKEILTFYNWNIKAPKTMGGIYAIYIKIPNDHELGIIGARQDGIKLNNAIRIIVEKMKSLHEVIYSRKLAGELSWDRNYQYKHVKMAFDIKGGEIGDFDPREMKTYELLNPKEKYDYLQILRQYLMMAPPIYIGITTERSLYTRIKEHYLGDTKLLQELSLWGLSELDIVFRCRALNNINKIATRDLELLLQYIYRPVFSLG